MSQESDVCNTTSMYDIQNRCIPGEIYLFYFKTCIITHNRSLALTETHYPGCGLLVTGYFNRLNIDGLQNHFRLKQIVKVPTRKKATLNLILTNMLVYYSPPPPPHKHTHRSGCPIATLLWQPLWTESATSTTKKLQ